MKRLRLAWGTVHLAIAILLMVLTVPQAQAGTTCTTYLSAPGPIPSALVGVVCLHGGTYPITQPTFSSTAPATLMSVPGEHAILQAKNAGGLWVRSPYITFDHLVIDNGGFSNAALAINTAAAHFTLSNSEVRNGSYYGIDDWAPYTILSDNTIHDFQPNDRIPGNDAQCHNIHGTASYGLLISSTVYNCWGDGIQFYVPIPTLTNTVTTGWIVTGNTFYRGTLGYSENAIDVKGTLSMTISNNEIYGYTNLGGLGTNQPAVVFHGDASNVVYKNNWLHDSAKGIELTNGTWVGLVVIDNTFTNSGYAMEFAGARGAIFRNNTIDHATTLDVIQVVANGWVGGSFDHNLIQNSTAPRLYSGASWSGVTHAPNAWINTSSGFLAGAGDVTTAQPGFGAPVTSTPTPTPTRLSTSTATAAPTSTATPTATITASPSPTIRPTPLGTPLGECWLMAGKGETALQCFQTP